MHEWQKDFALKDDLTQADFEALEIELSKMPRALLLRNTGSSLSYGAMLRSAIVAGWIASPECKCAKDKKTTLYLYDGKDVDKMHPAAVDWLGARIDERYNIVKGEIPKAL